MIHYTTPDTIDDYFNCTCTYYTLRELGYPSKALIHSEDCGKNISDGPPYHPENYNNDIKYGYN